MPELGIPGKRICLCRMILTDNKSSVMVDKVLTEPLEVKRGLRQGFIPAVLVSTLDVLAKTVGEISSSNFRV